MSADLRVGPETERESREARSADKEGDAFREELALRRCDGLRARVVFAPALALFFALCLFLGLFEPDEADFWLELDAIGSLHSGLD